MRRALGIVLLAGFGGLGLTTPRAEGDLVPPMTALALDAEACARCHAEAAEHWRDSLHARAWVDPVFAAEYDERPAASCRGCHDPAGEAGRAHGIDCATCHVRDGAIVVSQGTAAAAAAHPLAVDPTRDGVTECAGCHQFAFKDDGIHDPNEALQATVDEWRRSRAAADGVTCTECHFRGHALAGLGDGRLVERAVRVDVDPVRVGEDVVVDVRIEADRIGHAFPTGDVFRRAVLSVQTDDGAHAELSMQRWLARTADPDGNATHVRTVDDTRVPPPGRGEVRDRLVLDDTAATQIEWSLELQRLDPKLAASRGLGPQQVVVPVASGVAAIPLRARALVIGRGAAPPTGP